jgi:hypothetical protein
LGEKKRLIAVSLNQQPFTNQIMFATKILPAIRNNTIEKRASKAKMMRFIIEGVYSTL